MTKKDFIDQVTSSSGVSLSKKDTETLLEATFNAIGQAVPLSANMTETPGSL